MQVLNPNSVGHQYMNNAVIGGSGAWTLLKENKYSIKNIAPLKTPFGMSQPIFVIKKAGLKFLFLSRHGLKGYEINAPSVNYRANIYALKELNVERLLSWSGPGAIDRSLKIGQYVLPHDVIDETKNRDDTFYKGTGLGFIRQSPIFCPQMEKTLKSVLKSSAVPFTPRGVYVCTEGPRLETASEIKKYASFGGTLVGQTLVPEVFLARELEICYHPLCYITNYAEGIRRAPFKPGELFEGMLFEKEKRDMDKAVQGFDKIITELFQYLDSLKRDCYCNQLMARYRNKGLIKGNWKSWFRK